MDLKKTLSTILLSTSIGCSSLTLNPHEYQHQLSQLEQSVEDPHNIQKYLEDNEYIVDQEAMKVFSMVVRSSFFVPNAVHLHKNFLDTADEQETFLQQLAKDKFSEQKAKMYLQMFSSPNSIIISESTMNNPKETLIILSHERFHQELGKLSKSDYQLMKNVAQKIENIRIPYKGKALEYIKSEYQRLLREKGPEMEKHKQDLLTKSVVPGWIRMGSFEEIYAHCAAGKAPQELESYIQKHPKAWKIYSIIKQRVLDIEGYDRHAPLPEF